MVHCWKTLALEFVNTSQAQVDMSAVTDLGCMSRGEWGMPATLTSELFFGSISRSVMAHTL